MNTENGSMSAPVHAVVMQQFPGEGTRKRPLCMAYHVDYRWVPVIEFCETHVVWDDTQYDRTFPEPNEVFEMDEYDKFDLSMPIYVPAA